MKITDLINVNSICVDTDFATPLEAIGYLTDKLCNTGKINDRKSFLDSVLEREQEGPTALGELLAVPHGKSASVKEPCFALAITKAPILWQGVDEYEPVRIIVLLAIPPEHQSSTHIALLSELTGLLVDDDFRNTLIDSNPNQIIELISTAAA
ncbi:PTS sugar transporter subunit IIA [Vibrio mimicus]